MFHSINGGIIKLRGEKDDMFNDIWTVCDVNGTGKVSYAYA